MKVAESTGLLANGEQDSAVFFGSSPVDLVSQGRTKMAESTGLEPATSRVTGERSNQLNYDSTSG